MQKTIHDNLNGLLADTLVLEQKLRHYHWNVQGPQFFALHAKFEELYDRFAEVIDDVAERILTTGGKPIRTLSGALAAAAIKEDDGQPEALAMVRNLRADLEGLRERAVKGIAAAEEANDRGTVNLLDGLNDEIEKTLWMLKATLS
ncbi:MAG: DNA starvation/stationary phase protection protein [Candidatus Krumholzibacteria bacterium]|nr:DNA starvation/stationary phase protection protein [Candidatus Krumholzibacteria bacterium]